MFRNKSFPTLAVTLSSVALLLSVAACGANTTTDGGGSSADEGNPVAGGTAGIVQIGEPRSLDPAALSNTWTHQPVLGNALYGTLMINNINTFGIEYKMATDFSTTDGGTTFNLALQPGLTFTDDTPLDAAAVKFNWDRLKDPKLASTSIRQAGQIAGTEVIDAANLKVTMATPNPHFAEALVASALNWIASPTALQQGSAAFDENPVGAGPFTLVNWTRQDSMELTKNSGFWDAPKPYLDTMTIRTVADSSQRTNAVTTGAVDLSMEGSMSNINKVQASGFQSETVPTGGGQYIGMNQRRAPFNDIRARQAVQFATDVDNLNAVVYNSENEVPQTLFPESSPFHADIKLQNPNSEQAQKLFNELAAEGKPVSFTFLSYPGTEAKLVAEGFQAQMSAFDNVEVKVEVLDFAALTVRAGQRDFDMVVSSAITQDPDFPLWTAFHSKSQGNFVGVNDPELDTALDAGRIALTDADRTTAYTTAQERLVEVIPGIWYTRAVPSVVYGKNVHGVEMYTLGSPLPENIWKD